MRVRLATPRRSSPTSSLRAYAYRVYESLRSAPEGTAEIFELPNGAEARWGGVLRPVWYQRSHRFPTDGSLWHATEPNAALAGVDVVTVHDLYMFQARGLAMRLARSSTLHAIEQARRIVVQTAVGREELRTVFGEVVWRKTRVVPLAFPTISLVRPAPTYDLLWLGNLDARKHPDRFLIGLANRPAPRLRVAFLCHRAGHGSAEPVQRAFEAARRLHDVDWIDRVLSPDELDQLYRSTRVLVSTSSLEGFHAPVTEAWLRGTRVVLPDIPVYREIYGSADGVHYYAPEAGFGEPVSAALAAGGFRPSDAVVHRLSAPECGRQMWAVYRELGEPAPPTA